MRTITSLALVVPDPQTAAAFYASAFGLRGGLRFRTSRDPSSGFRGFVIALTVAQPADVMLMLESALAAGATSLTPYATSSRGAKGSVRAPDGSVWTVASARRRNRVEPSKRILDMVALLAADDLRASRRFYVKQGFRVRRSLSPHVEFKVADGSIGLALADRRLLARDAGVPPHGTGAHRLVLVGGHEDLLDRDGFVWEADGGSR